MIGEKVQFDNGEETSKEIERKYFLLNCSTFLNRVNKLESARSTAAQELKKAKTGENHREMPQNSLKDQD